jgi:hypothetical protein
MDNLVALGTPSTTVAAVATSRAHSMGANMAQVLAFGESKFLALLHSWIHPKSHACIELGLPYEATMGTTPC